MVRGAVILLTLASLWAPNSSAQARRRALVMANQAYTGAPLKNPINDARAVAGALSQSGFAVRTAFDLTRATMRQTVNAFVGQDVQRGDVVVVYYAGHGMEIKGRNYLLGVDFSATNEDDAVDMAYDIETLMARIDSSGAALKVLVLDACRNDPFSRRWSRSAGGRGFAAVERFPTATYIAFASAPGQVASDGLSGQRNSPFASAFARHVVTPGLELDRVFRRVRATVMESTANRQVPWSNHSITGTFFFVRGAPPSPSAPPSVAPTTAPPARPTAASEWVRVPGARALWVGRTEVTVSQYAACVAARGCTPPRAGPDPCRTLAGGGCNWGVPGRERHPVNCVTGAQARAFATWAGSRLPTAQEWRRVYGGGGTGSPHPWGPAALTCDRANVATAASGESCGSRGTTAVCGRRAGWSPQGICDLAGNVAEWTESGPFAGSGLVARGGSWRVPPIAVNATLGGGPTGPCDDHGIRLVRDTPP